MDAPTTTPAARRRRVLLVAGLGAALAVGSLVLPSAANAVTPPPNPTVTLAAPAQIINQGTPDPGQIYTLTIDNSATGSAVITTDSLVFAMGLPTGLACNDITLTAVGTAPPLSLSLVTGGQCNKAVALPSIPVGVTTYQYNVAIDGKIGSAQNPIFVTGAVSSAFELAVTSGLAPASNLATGSSNLVNPSAPVLTTAPGAIVHNAYSAQVLTAGFPRPTYTVYEKHVSAANPPVTSYTQICPAPVSEAAITPDVVVPTTCTLNDGLVFGFTTGRITATAAALTDTDATPPTYVIVANNGNGGAAAVSAGPPAVALHDVSVTVTIPVLFSDVAPASLFGPDIYALAGAGVISGLADGSFAPLSTVKRQEFAAFAAKIYNLTEPDSLITIGACTSQSQDKFTDVAVNSTFCGEINGLAALGIISGHADGTFGGTAIVSRQEIAAFLYREDQVLHGATVTPIAPHIADAPCPAAGSGFADVSSTNPFCGDIAWAATNSITSGATATTFQPNGPAQRQAAAAFVFRFGQLEGVFS